MNESRSIDPASAWCAGIDAGLRNEAKSLTTPTTYTWSGSTGYSGYTPATAYDYRREVGDLGSSALVAIAMRWLKRAALQGEMRIGQQVEGVYEVQEPDHPAMALIRRPNPWQSARVFWGGTYEHLIVAGEAFWVKIRARLGGPPTELVYVPAHQIEVVEDINRPRPIRGYRYHHPGGVKTLDLGDVVHLRLEHDRIAWWRGVSPLREQVANIAGMNVAARWTAAVLRNGHSGTVLIPDSRIPTMDGYESPDEAAMRMAARSLEMDLSGENASRVRALLIPATPARVGFSPEELALDRILDRPESMILAAMGVNSHVLALPSSAATRTYENSGEYYKQAWENGVTPLQDAVAEDGIAAQVLYQIDEKGERIAEWPGDPDDLCCWWDRTEIAAMNEDADSKVTRAAQIWTSDLATLDEARQLCDLPPMEGENGKRFYSDKPGAKEDEPPPGEDEEEEEEPGEITAELFKRRYTLNGEPDEDDEDEEED